MNHAKINTGIIDLLDADNHPKQMRKHPSQLNVILPNLFILTNAIFDNQSRKVGFI